mmetsp:Transcript_26957/g.69463  ORF Transcript_26957/g.69463 Transcript_26957/m.69463 type:complete len:86 (-) Transcript_26957:193-450(-)
MHPIFEEFTKRANQERRKKEVLVVPVACINQHLLFTRVLAPMIIRHNTHTVPMITQHNTNMHARTHNPHIGFPLPKQISKVQSFT